MKTRTKITALVLAIVMMITMSAFASSGPFDLTTSRTVTFTNTKTASVKGELTIEKNWAGGTPTDIDVTFTITAIAGNFVGMTGEFPNQAATGESITWTPAPYASGDYVGTVTMVAPVTNIVVELPITDADNDDIMYTVTEGTVNGYTLTSTEVAPPQS